jgi:NAD(P)-dependent dehydrogenase (short-subunit alcohol dehydrogenase family)
VGEAALTGYVEQMALHLAPRFIRVNCVHPTNVNTHLLHNDGLYRMFRPDLENPTREDVIPAFTMFQAMPIPYVEPVDFSSLVLFLASDEAGASPASRSASAKGHHPAALRAAVTRHLQL